MTQTFTFILICTCPFMQSYAGYIDRCANCARDCGHLGG